MDSLNENNVYRLTKGRVLGDDTGGAVKDVVLTGLHSLTEGEKDPTYRLQRSHPTPTTPARHCVRR